jgi:hypothetical protein
MTRDSADYPFEEQPAVKPAALTFRPSGFVDCHADNTGTTSLKKFQTPEFSLIEARHISTRLRVRTTVAFARPRCGICSLMGRSRAAPQNKNSQIATEYSVFYYIDIRDTILMAVSVVLSVGARTCLADASRPAAKLAPLKH